MYGIETLFSSHLVQFSVKRKHFLNNYLFDSHSWLLTNLFISSDLVLYTIVIVDIRKCNNLLINAFEAASINEAKLNIIENYQQIGSKYTLDTIVFILLLTLGNFTGIVIYFRLLFTKHSLVYYV